jgi:hypothetical protein
MYKNELNQRIIASILLCTSCFYAKNVKAQLSLTGQLRTRGELRDGYDTSPLIKPDKFKLLSMT